MLLRLKEDYDGAEPAPASVTVRNLITLGQLRGDSGLIARAGRTLERYGPHIGQVVRVMPLMVANVALWRARRGEIVIVGTPGADDTLALERVLARRYLPWAIVVPRDPAIAASALARAPWLQAMTMRDGRATAYVCEDFACQQPVTDGDALERQLENASTPRRIII